jgi:predicted nucleotidyltransferase
MLSPLTITDTSAKTLARMTVADLQTHELRQACKTFKVKELYAFGSVLSGELTAESDLDFLVQFEREGADGAFAQFMGFKEKLEELYGRPVDLLTHKRFRNPVFQEEIDRSKSLIYAA